MSALVLPDLTTAPATGGLFWKAALSMRRKPGEAPAIPANAVTLKNLVLDGAHLAAYNAVCEVPDGLMVITYPQVVVAALHMHLMTQPNFPLPLVGIVHLANTFTQHAPLTVGVPYDVQARIATSRRSKLGIEVDLVTEFRGGEALLWTSTMTVLHRIKAKSKSRSAPPPPAPVAAAEYQPFTVPEDTGRRYAPVARDYNPIHLYPFTARLLGFDRAIAHGMWSVARCLGLMLPAYAAAQGGLPSRLTIQFKQPLLLPGRVTLKQVAGEAGMEFDLLAREGGRTHLSGRLEGVLAATGM